MKYRAVGYIYEPGIDPAFAQPIKSAKVFATEEAANQWASGNFDEPVGVEPVYNEEEDEKPF